MPAIKAKPIDDLSALPRVNSPEELVSCTMLSIYSSGSLKGVRRRADTISFNADYLCIPRARVIVINNQIFYLTSNNEYFPDYYPKTWPYAKFLENDGKTLSIEIDQANITRLRGAWFMPYCLEGNWFHTLLDNYARLYFLNSVPFKGNVRVGIPTWGGGDASLSLNDRGVIRSLFLSGVESHTLEFGVYEVDQAILPPLGNKNDYINIEPLKFVSKTLRGGILPNKVITHTSRIFVSRSDTNVRTLINEKELCEELIKLGFTIICPGDYSFITQLQIFSSAEIIVGVHGQGFVPMICASECKAVLEYEAFGWSASAYRSIADAMGVHYQTMPVENIEIRNPARFDWTASACISESLEIIKQFL